MGAYLGSGGKPACYALETTSYGHADTPDVALDLVNESLRENTEPLRSPAIFGSRAYNTYHQGTKSAAGDLRFIAQPDSLPKLIYGVLGAEAAAARVGETTAYDHVFTPAVAGGDLPSFHIEVDRHGTVCQYPGSVIDTMTIEFTKGAYLEVVLSLLCQKETDDQSSTDLSLSTKDPYIGDFVELEVGGSGVTYGIGGSITIQNFIDADASHRLDGTRYRAEPHPQNFMVSGSIDLEWTSDTDALRDAIKDNTDVDLCFVCTSEETIEAGYYYAVTFDIPTCRLIGDLPVISTRDRIPFTINFEGIYNATNLMAITHRDARTTKWSE